MTESSKLVRTAAKPPNAGKGRKKGVPNKTTLIAKEAIAAAADKLGGVERLVSWAQEDALNERAFWSTIYPKLLPLQVNAELETGPRFAKVIRELVRPSHTNG